MTNSILPQHRADFIEKIETLQQALKVLDSSETPEDSSPLSLARNGLLVVAYGQFEKFITLTCQSLCKTLNPQISPITSLPEDLQHELAFKSMKNMVDKIKFETKEKSIMTQKSFDIAQNAAQMSRGTYTISEYTFKPSGYNFSPDDLRDFLKLAKIGDGWGKMKKVASQIGFGTPDLRYNFSEAHKNRNNAAHDADYEAPRTDVESNLRTLLITACTFEILFNRGIGLIENNVARASSGESELDESVTGWGMELMGSHWKIFPDNNNNRRAKISERDLNDCVRRGLQNSSHSRNQFLFTRGADSIVDSWYLSHDYQLTSGY